MSDNQQGPGGFRAPGNPAIPQDLALIMEMVGAQQGTTVTVGTASEARATMEQEGGKMITATVETQADSDSSDSETSVDSSDDADAMVEADSDAESDSDVGVTTSAPMSAGTHAHLLSQLTSFVKGGSSSGPVNNVVDSDDEDFILSEPLATEHEVPLPTVQAPPIEKVPDDEKRVLAGAVMSWMPAKGVIEWLRTQEEEDKEEEEVAAGIMLAEDDEEKAPEVTASAEVKEEIAASGDAEVNESETGPSSAPIATPIEAEPQASPLKLDKGKGKATSKFPSSGTVVIRAIHNPQASAGDGWLEEGSLLCWEDGRVLGTVSETFGPLTSPFYQVRVAPPPFPFPSPESLEPGTKLYYPHTSQYRSFVPVRMLQTDPRLKGSDASNRYDEEVGEDEMEWSDDEMEAAAKRGKKQRKGKGARQGSAAPSAGAGGFQHPLPPRPHFDHEGGDDEPLLYDGMDAGSDWGGSEAGSMAGGRAKPAPYEVDDAAAADTVPRRGQEERRGKGRGGKPTRGRGGRQPQNSGPSSLPPRPAPAASGPPLGFAQGAPGFQPQPQFAQQQFMPQQFPYQQQMPGFGGYYPNPQQQQFMMMMQQQQQQYGYHPQGHGFMPQQQPQQQVQQQQQPSPQQPQPVAPAINPRFAAQYQHMMNGPQAGGAPPSDRQQ